MAARSAIFIALMLVAALARAETYKWVDERGVTTYSSTPPPGGAKTIGLQRVPDRISVYATDPALNRDIELYRRMDLAEAEWLQRQQLMAMQAAVAPYPSEPFYRTAAYFPARQSRRAASRRR